MGLQVAAAGKIINEFTGLAFAGGEFETDNPAIRFVSAEAWTANAQGAHITFATAPIGTSSPVEGMRLTSEGILLVGTDTASGSAKLQVSGTINVSGITYAGTLALSATGANVITLSTNGSERARVSSGGNLLVGGTTDGNYKLDVASSGASGTLRVYDQTAVTGSTSLVVRAGAGQSSNILFQLQDNSANVFMTAYASNGSIYFQAPGVASSEAYMLPGSGVFEFGGNTGVALKLTANAQERLRLNATGVGFFGATPVAKQTVTADAASILAALQAYGLAV